MWEICCSSPLSTFLTSWSTNKQNNNYYLSAPPDPHKVHSSLKYMEFKSISIEWQRFLKDYRKWSVALDFLELFLVWQKNGFLSWEGHATVKQKEKLYLHMLASLWNSGRNKAKHAVQIRLQAIFLLCILYRGGEEINRNVTETMRTKRYKKFNENHFLDTPGIFTSSLSLLVYSRLWEMWLASLSFLPHKLFFWGGDMSHFLSDIWNALEA